MAMKAAIFAQSPPRSFWTRRGRSGKACLPVCPPAALAPLDQLYDVCANVRARRAYNTMASSRSPTLNYAAARIALTVGNDPGNLGHAHPPDVGLGSRTWPNHSPHH